MKENNDINWNKDILPSLGGKARALIQKEEARKRVDEYNMNPNLCLNCGKPILAPYGKKLRETKIKKFCSKSCAAQYNNQHRKNNVKKIRKLDLISDDKLINMFEQSTSLAEFADKIGYNKKSLYIHYITERLDNLGINLDELKQVIRSDNTFSMYTKKDAFEIYQNWQSVRSTIAKLARNIYAKSNRPKYCVICGYEHYEVAHIKAVSDFPDDALISEINAIENLIGLCPNHHYEYDNGILTKEELLNTIYINTLGSTAVKSS